MGVDEHEHMHHLAEQFDLLGQEIEELKQAMIQNFAGGELRRIIFNGKVPGGFQALDDSGSDALAYAIYNPTELEVFVGLAGLPPSANGLVIPAKKLVVAPVAVNGSIQLAVDATKLAEKEVSVLRVRFPTPQPFFVGALA